MDFVSIALIIVGIWICVSAFVLAILKAAARADSDEERLWASLSDAAADEQSLTGFGPTLGHTQQRSDPAVLARDVDRLGTDVPKRWHPRLKRAIGAWHHHSHTP